MLKGENMTLNPADGFTIIKLRMDDEDTYPSWNIIIKHLILLDLCVDQFLFLDEIKNFQALTIINYTEKKLKYSTS